jgi:hypothetical protein
MTAYFGPSSVIVGATVTGPVAVATNTYSTAAFTAPAVLLWVHVVFTATATVGGRILWVEQLDGSSNHLQGAVSGVTGGQIANAVQHYKCVSGTYREAAFVNNSIELPIPTNWVFRTGDVLRIKDNANIDAADSMSIAYSTFP